MDSLGPTGDTFFKMIEWALDCNEDYRGKTFLQVKITDGEKLIESFTHLHDHWA